MLKVYEKEYSTSPSADVNSFAKALSLIVEEINNSGKKCNVLHTENEKRYKVESGRKDFPYYRHVRGTAVVLVEFID